MSAAPAKTREGLVASWTAQMIGTLVLCGAALVFMKTIGKPLVDGDSDWRRYAAFGIILGIAPALLYLNWFRRILDQDERLERERGGVPEPAARALLQKSLILGGALCEIPMAMGVVQLLLGGETRWFLGATLITVALRLSFRPFTRRR